MTEPLRVPRSLHSWGAWRLGARNFRILDNTIRIISIRKVEFRDIEASKQEVVARYKASRIEIFEHR
jgi:hypothetical protein